MVHLETCDTERLFKTARQVQIGTNACSSEGGPSKPKKSKKSSSQQKGCPPLTPTDPSGNRKYKQYTEETLQQALKDVAEGQSINR